MVQTAYASFSTRITSTGKQGVAKHSKQMLENHNESHNKSHKLQGVCQGQNMTLIRLMQSYLLPLLYDMAVKFMDRAFGEHT